MRDYYAGSTAGSWEIKWNVAAARDGAERGQLRFMGQFSIMSSQATSIAVSILSRRSCLPLRFKEATNVTESSNFKYPTKTPCIGPSTQRGWLPLPHPCSSTLTSYNRHLLRSMPAAAPASSIAHLTNTSSLLTSPASPFICPICLRPSFSFYCCWLFWPAACFTRCYDGIINIFALASWTTSELCYRDLSVNQSGLTKALL